VTAEGATGGSHAAKAGLGKGVVTASGGAAGTTVAATAKPHVNATAGITTASNASVSASGVTTAQGDSHAHHGKGKGG